MLVIVAKCEPMSRAGHGPKHGSRHGRQIIAKTGQRGPVLYKGVNNAAHLPEGGLDEARGLPTSSLPLMDNAPSDTDARLLD